MIVAVLFAGAAWLHRGPRRRERHLEGALDALRREQLRAEGRWQELPRTGAGLLPGRPHASDLGLVGEFSLFRALSRCATPFGERRLAELLGDGAPLAEIPARQAALPEGGGTA